MNEPDYASTDFDKHTEQAQKVQQAAIQERASAYHRVFAQNKDGNKILAEWIELYCTGQPPSQNASEREVGMMDGKREIVSMILKQIAKGEGNG